ncbi:MAG: hypothetical protein ACLQM8_18655 [Limisphaerales bacterium]
MEEMTIEARGLTKVLSIGALVSALALAASLARHYQHLFRGFPL